MPPVKPAVIGGATFEWGRRAYVVGVVNATPDSFSGDGLTDPDAAIARGLAMAAAGASILDVGGESTRPGHEPVTASVEIGRVVPVIAGLAPRAGVPISIDTSKQEVADAAVEAGASIVNDVWALQRSPGLAALAASRGLGLVLTHNQAGHEYGELMAEITAGLERARDAALAAGVRRELIILDPGLGFGKTAEQNLVVLRRLAELRRLGQPILVGASRKSFLGKLFGQEGEERRDGTAAAVAASVLRGADLVRVHDVPEMVRVVRVAEALR